MKENKNIAWGMFAYGIGLAVIFWFSQFLEVDITPLRAAIGCIIGFVAMFIGLIIIWFPKRG